MNVDRPDQPHRGVPPLLLIVDDDSLMRAMYKQLFVSLGLRCIACSRPDEALHVLFAKVPNLITLDYDLPGMPGPELAKVLRAIWPDIPLLLLTGQDCVSPEDRKHFDGVHHKGEDPEGLVRHIRHLFLNNGAYISSSDGDNLINRPCTEEVGGRGQFHASAIWKDSQCLSIGTSTQECHAPLCQCLTAVSPTLPMSYERNVMQRIITSFVASTMQVRRRI